MTQFFLDSPYLTFILALMLILSVRDVTVAIIRSRAQNKLRDLPPKREKTPDKAN